MIELEYTKVGDYNMPNLTMKQEKLPTGKFATMRLHYLKKNKKGEYTILLMNEQLAKHLTEIQEMATKMVTQIIEKMAKQDGITEELKAKDQMTWVKAMNKYKRI